MTGTPEMSPPRPPRRRRWLVLALLMAVAGGLGLWAAWGSSRPAATTRAVRYVGDAACTRCHAEIAASYRQHPMGRSLAPIAQAPPEVRGTAESRDLFEAQGLHFSVRRRDGRTYHREERRDHQGRTVAAAEAEIQYVLGSGTRGLTFLTERDGFLRESPITWYPQKQRWDISPGYEEKNLHFERQVFPECLFCHTNRYEHVPGTLNQYRPPTFRGHAIGCERCHGPGERHLAHPSGGPDGTPTIVNPRTLEPALREDVCQQCHLIGEARVTRPGRDLLDYRPGLPLTNFLTVFVRRSGSAEAHKNGDQVEQMARSRCYRASRGALGCISCHDPHQLPAPEKKVAYYRGRCLECHAERGCALPEATRRAESPADSCIACHMPRAAITDIAHVATTIHSIPRHRPRSDPNATPSNAGKPSETPASRLVPFHWGRMSPDRRRQTRRDLWVALDQKGRPVPPDAILGLANAVAEHPDDLDALEAEGNAFGAIPGRTADGLAAFEAALSQAPNRETSLAGAALFADALGQSTTAIAYWKRAIAVNPWHAVYSTRLAHLLAREGRWREAAEESRRTLRLNPFDFVARKVLVESLARTGSPDRAQAELETLLKLDPPDPADLVRWFRTLR